MERLEERYLLTADTLQSLLDGDEIASQASTSMVYLTSPPAPPGEVLGGGGSALATAPFPLEQTFFLHSLPGATKTMYLDFDGHLTRETQWNTDFNRPNILTPAFDMDGDTTQFSDFELLTIQHIWERVTEDFRPFNINVTTEDPGVEALRNLGEGTIQLPTITNTTSEVIEDQATVFSTLNFSGPITSITDINVTLNISHTWDSDLSALLISPQGTVIDLFSGVGGDGNNFLNTIFDDQATVAITDQAATPPFAGSFQPIEALSGLNGEDPNGIWTLEVQDNRPDDEGVLNSWSLTITGSAEGDNQWGQRVVIGGSTNDWFTPVSGEEVGGVAFASFSSDTDVPCFVFNVGEFSTAETISHEVGHTLGLAHDGQFRDWRDVTDPAAPVWHTEYIEYYNGHGSGPTSWGPIMGAPFPTAGAPNTVYRDLTQWSKGEYANATNDEEGTSPLQDDLAIITSLDNGVDYRADDHGGDTATASLLTLDSSETMYFAEGIIEQNTDVDYFSFTVEGLGEIVSLDISPFTRGPNLDILATLYSSSGAVIATSNPPDSLYAGTQTFGSYTDGGWRRANGTYTDEFLLAPGTYYVSVEGTGRPLTFIDPAMPPDIAMPPDPFDPLMHLPPDTSDWGYSDYASLGYYSITGIRKKGLVVGVDFDGIGGTSPANWATFSGGGPQSVMTNLRSEAGVSVPYQLTISTTGTSIEAFPSMTPINPADLPSHALELGPQTGPPATDGLGGYLAGGSDIWTFTWGNLVPGEVYEVYVFGHADIPASNIVEVVGGIWNGEVQTYEFTQMIAPDGLVVNSDDTPGGEPLSTMPLLVVAAEVLDAEGNPTGVGQITINVTNELGFAAALGGLAIAPTKLGSISGVKWNDANGNRLRDGGEEGLEGWVIYLDLNNNGQLDLISTPPEPIQVAAPNVPQEILDYNTVKNELFFESAGEIIDVDVTLDISHTYVGDLDVYLVSPAGTRVKLFDDIPSFEDNFTNTTFDDEAARPITEGTAPFTGRFRPEPDFDWAPFDKLSAFDGEDALGLWTLEIADDALNDVGVLNSWSITITLSGFDVFLEPFTVTDASGGYSFENLLPGPYNVREHIQTEQALEGWQQTWAPPQVTVASGGRRTGINFGNWIPTEQRGSIQGQKWNDLNGDGAKDGDEPGLPGWTIYVDSNQNRMLDVASVPTTLSATDLPKPIHENLPPATSQVEVDTIGTILEVEVTLDITHSFVGDLDAHLTSPSGRVVELFTRVGGQFNNFVDLILDDGAAESIETIGFDDYVEGVGYTGRWRPEGLLSDFIGENPNGVWTLTIQDAVKHDQGTLNSWSLTITIGELLTQTDADGNYSFPNLPAGEYVIREEQQSGWSQTTPQIATIPGAIWADSQWTVTIVGLDDPNDPNGPDSQRNVKNVDFGNQSGAPLLAGDYNGDGSVDAADYVVWRKSLSAIVSPPFSGADGNGSGTVDNDDYGVWAANFGASSGGGSAEQPAETGELAIESSSPTVVASSSSSTPTPAELLKFAAEFGSSASEINLAAADRGFTQNDGPVGSGQAAVTPAAGSAFAARSSDFTHALSRKDPLGRTSAASHQTSDAALVAWLVALARDPISVATDDDESRETGDESWGEDADFLAPIDSVFEVLGA